MDLQIAGVGSRKSAGAGSLGTTSFWNVLLSYTKFGLNRLMDGVRIDDAIMVGGGDRESFVKRMEQRLNTVSMGLEKNINFQKTRHYKRLSFAWLVGHNEDILFVHLHTQGKNIVMIEQLT